MLIKSIFTSAVLLLAVASCKQNDTNELQSSGGTNQQTKGGSGNARILNESTCVEGSGANAGNAANCGTNQTIKTCSKENLAGRCINKKGAADESTIYYYSGHSMAPALGTMTAEIAKNECLQAQAAYQGVFVP